MDTTSSTTIRMPGTPKPWMNRTMKVLLRTPGVRRLLGRMFAIITVTGARTGRRYETPVQLMCDDGRHVVLSQRHRVWWRNIRTHPEVELLVRGGTVAGRAHVAEGDEARELIARLLQANPRVARFYGIEIDHSGNADPDGVDALDRAAVAIVIDT
jgi:deazaflavin-dependent oxidoreductase (nitroreductase family)